MANERPFPTGIDLKTKSVINLADPTNPQDGATKNYVDNTALGLTIKVARVVATSNISVSSAPASVDSVTLGSGDILLLIGQGSNAENGLWQYAAAASPLTRYAASATKPGLLVVVTEGTVNHDKMYLLTTDAPIIVGTTLLSFTAFTPGVTYTASNGVLLTGTNFTVQNADSSISVAGGGIAVALATASGLSISSGLKVTTPFVPFATGSANATSTTVTHNFGTLDVGVQVFDGTTGEEQSPGITRTTNTVVVQHGSTLAANAWRIICWKVA